MELANHMLSDVDIIKSRELLKPAHEYFYHCTWVNYIDSIKNKGLDPAFEGEDSYYPDRNLEPDKAIRYCTKDETNLFYHSTRNRYNPGDGAYSKVILLRTKASGLLDKDFGLDHSYTEVSRLIGEKIHLMPDEFVEIVKCNNLHFKLVRPASSAVLSQE